MVFEKFTSAYLFQIAREKSCDYLLGVPSGKCQRGEFDNLLWDVPNGPSWIGGQF